MTLINPFWQRTSGIPVVVGSSQAIHCTHATHSDEQCRLTMSPSMSRVHHCPTCHLLFQYTSVTVQHRLLYPECQNGVMVNLLYLKHVQLA